MIYFYLIFIFFTKFLSIFTLFLSFPFHFVFPHSPIFIPVHFVIYFSSIYHLCQIPSIFGGHFCSLIIFYFGQFLSICLVFLFPSLRSLILPRSRASSRILNEFLLLIEHHLNSYAPAVSLPWMAFSIVRLKRSSKHPLHKRIKSKVISRQIFFF